MSKNFLSRVANIELYNLKNIVPFSYKNGDKFTEIKDSFYTVKDDTINININTTNTSIPLSRIYFKNGYNEYILFDSYVKNKYNIKYSD